MNARIDWSVSARSLERESGDQYIVMPFRNGVLMGVIDGLGHGLDAAAAARSAVGLIAAHAHLPLPALVQRCHDGLKSTRGAVLSLAAFCDGDDLAWLGVGNVDGVLLRGPERPGRPERLLVRGGVVGRTLPAVEVSHVAVVPGDVLVLATDGVSGDFAEDLIPGTPEATADRILAEYGKKTDDALVMVARYLGARA